MAAVQSTPRLGGERKGGAIPPQDRSRRWLRRVALSWQLLDLPIGWVLVLDRHLGAGPHEVALQVQEQEVRVLMGQHVLEESAVLRKVVVRDDEGVLVERILRRGQRRRPYDRVHREQEGQGEEHRQAASERVHSGLLVQLHLLFLLLLAVVLVFLLKLLQLRLERLHVLHALDLFDPQGEQEEPDRERQENDRDAVVRDDVVDPRQDPAQSVQEPLP